MWLEAIRRAEGHETGCPTCGGAVQRRPYGEMHAGSFVRDGERVEIRRVPDAGFADPIVLDPLCQYFDGNLYRLWPKERYFSRGGSRLHRDVWVAAFGPIPDGCHIHHRDGDSANNRLSNLECIASGEHLSKEWERRHSGKAVHFTASARHAAAEWHRSEAGRAWHRRHARRSKGWKKWKREDRPCVHCGTIIHNALVRKQGHSQKYCTETCKALAYRQREAARRNR